MRNLKDNQAIHKMPKKRQTSQDNDLINSQCFISYSWDSANHKDWVRELANRLQLNGVSTSLDQWDVMAGMDVPNYVETRIRESAAVLLVCTPTFAKKANSNRGGVGYEKTVITGEIFQGIGADKKLIPLLRSGTPKSSMPSYLKARAFIDFSKDGDFDHAFDELLRSIFSAPRYVRPRLGKIPLLEPLETATRPNRSPNVRPAITKVGPRKLFARAEMKPSQAKSPYASNVFINCPNTESYAPLLRAIVFTVTLAGFRPRSALELTTGSSRYQKLFTLISGCKYGIHDISQNGLNQSFELGVFMGAQRFESNSKRERSLLILNSEPYRYQKMLSDLSGSDVSTHYNRVSNVILIVRDWLHTATPKSLPGGKQFYSEYQRFARNLPRICKESMLSIDRITFNDFANIVAKYITLRVQMSEGNPRRST